MELAVIVPETATVLPVPLNTASSPETQYDALPFASVQSAVWVSQVVEPACGVQYNATSWLATVTENVVSTYSPSLLVARTVTCDVPNTPGA